MIKLSDIFKKRDQSQAANLPKGIKPDTRSPEDVEAAAAEIKKATEARHHIISSVKLSPALTAELDKERPTTPGITNLYGGIVSRMSLH